MYSFKSLLTCSNFVEEGVVDHMSPSAAEATASVLVCMFIFSGANVLATDVVEEPYVMSVVLV